MKIGDVLGVAFLVAAVYMIVRPRSNSVDLVKAIGDVMIALVRRAADLGKE